VMTKGELPPLDLLAATCCGITPWTIPRRVRSQRPERAKHALVIRLAIALMNSGCAATKRAIPATTPESATSCKLVAAPALRTAVARAAASARSRAVAGTSTEVNVYDRQRHGVVAQGRDARPPHQWEWTE
jgi:hypothetical protein